MDKNNFIDWVSLGPLRSSVVLLVGEQSTNLLTSHRKIVNPNLTNKKIEDIKCSILDGMYPGNKGVAFECDGNFYIYMSEWSTEVFLHEAYHVVNRKLKMADIVDSNGEVGARLIEYLYIRLFVESKILNRFKNERN